MNVTVSDSRHSGRHFGENQQARCRTGSSKQLKTILGNILTAGSRSLVLIAGVNHSCTEEVISFLCWKSSRAIDMEENASSR